MSDSEHTIDLDLRGIFCPMAFVKLRLKADQMGGGATMNVIYEDTPSNEPLARSTTAVGHEVISDTCYTGDLAQDGEDSLKIMTVRVVK